MKLAKLVFIMSGVGIIWAGICALIDKPLTGLATGIIWIIWGLSVIANALILRKESL